MSGVYYVFISSFALRYRFYARKTIKHAFSMFYTLIKHRSERALGPIYILNSDKTWVFDQSERAQGPIYIIKLLGLISLKPN